MVFGHSQTPVPRRQRERPCSLGSATNGLVVDDADELEGRLVRQYLRQRAIIAALALVFGSGALIAGSLLLVGAFMHPGRREPVRTYILAIVLGVITIGIGVRIVQRGMPNQWFAAGVPPMPRALFGKTLAIVIGAALALGAIPLGLYGRALFLLRSHTSACADLWTVDEIRAISVGATPQPSSDHGGECTVHVTDGARDVAVVQMRKDKVRIDVHGRYLLRDYGSLPKKPVPALGPDAMRFETKNEVVVAWQRGEVAAFVYFLRERFSDDAIAEVVRLLATRDDVLKRFE